MTVSTQKLSLSQHALRACGLALAFASAPVLATAQDTATSAEKAEAFRKNVTLLGIPPATVAPDGLAFAAVAWTNKRNGMVDDPDGSAAVGFGVGVGDDLFDLQFTAHITSLKDDFADSGFLSVRASKRIDSGGVPTFLGVGVGNFASWGKADGQDTSVSGSLTAFPAARIAGDLYPIMFTVGAGNQVRNFGQDYGVFAGVGIGLTESFGTSIAFNGENFDVGASFRIPGVDSLGFNVVLSDAFDADDRQRVILSVSWITDNVF